MEKKSADAKYSFERVLTEDLTNGTEPFKLRVINAINTAPLAPFEYITSTEKAANLICSCKDEKCTYNHSNIAHPGFFQVFYANSKKEWTVQTLAPIAEGTPIGEYTGVLRKADDFGTEMQQNDDYIVGFTYNGEDYLLDAHRKGNMARFISHCCRPNCRAVLANIGNDSSHMPRVIICALRDIEAGEEIHIDYGEQWWIAKAGKVTCKCHSRICKYGKEWSAEMKQSIKLLNECSISSKAVEDEADGKTKNGIAFATKSAEGNAIAVKSSEGQPIAVKSAEGEIIAVKSSEAQPIAIKSAQGQPIAVKSAEGKVVAVKSAEGQSIAYKSATGQPIAVKSFEGEMIAVKSAVGQPMAFKSVQNQSISTKSVGSKAVAAIATKSAHGEQTLAIKSVDGQLIAAKSVVDAQPQVAAKSVVKTAGGINGGRATAKKSVETDGHATVGALKAVGGGCAVPAKSVVGGNAAAIKTVE